VPEIRARIRDAGTHGIKEIAPLLAHKTRARPDEMQLRVVGSAMLAAVFVALDAWQQDGGKGDLLALFDQAIDALAEGMSGLRPRRDRSGHGA
jgi:hypothetical protein